MHPACRLKLLDSKWDASRLKPLASKWDVSRLKPLASKWDESRLKPLACLERMDFECELVALVGIHLNRFLEIVFAS